MKYFIVIVFTITNTFASGIEEAPYSVTQEYDEWEVRSYPPTKWISTDVQDVKPHDGLENDLVTINQVLFDRFKFENLRHFSVYFITLMVAII